MQKQYAIRPKAPSAVHEELAVYPEFLRDLLYQRGVDTKEKAQMFLNPSYDNHTHDPFLIAGMEKAVERILRGVKENEHIVIWSDYDHDGIPGGVILYDFFKKIGYSNFENYIPNRHTEGYGFNVARLEKLKDGGATLVITVDSGISDVEPVKRGNELGLDIIITDHHLTHDTLPPAYVILNSKQEHCGYPFNMLCGAAVAFKLVQALIARGNFGITPGWEKWLLDLVGLSTIADMVPLQGENRVLAHYGLKVLQKTRRPGLLKLFRRINLNPRNLSEDDVGFMISPRINAASRMDDPRIAFDLLTSTDEDGRSDALARELEELNSVRKGVVGSMVKEMKHTLSMRQLGSVIVIGNPLWRPALLGLAANTIMEEHTKPVFLWGREGGERFKGSCRSDGSVDVVQLMQKVAPGVLMEFGGHALSGGFSVHPEKIHDLEEYIVGAYEEAKEKSVEQSIWIDKKLSVDEISYQLWNLVSVLAPFGVDNPKPLFLIEGEIVRGIKKFGKRSEHTELLFKKTDGTPVKAISFFSGSDFDKVKEFEPLNFVANLEKSFFGYRPELRLRIVDIL